jgi:hypothetical protein
VDTDNKSMRINVLFLQKIKHIINDNNDRNNNNNEDDEKRGRTTTEREKINNRDKIKR